METESIVMILVIGAVAGWLTGLLLRGSGYGIIGDTLIGLVGAFVGNWLLHTMSFSVNLGSPIANRFVVSVIGAVILMLAVTLVRKRSLR